MPLTPKDRLLLNRINHLKLYLLLLAGAVFIYLLFLPASELQMATSVLGMALCGVFWVTHKLLTFIALLDVELTRVVNTLKRIVPEHRLKDI
mgnify:FL=1